MVNTELLHGIENRSIFAVLIRNRIADKLNMLYLSGFCHSMIYPIQNSESD